MKFTAHERDFTDPDGPGDDLDYMHARYCNPLLGRFLSFDPVGGKRRRPQSWNRYAYALDNPIKFNDPRGLRPPSQQGRNTFERAVDELSLLFEAALSYFVDEKANEEDALDSEADADLEKMSAELAAEGIDPSMLPANRARQYKKAMISAQATLAAGAVVVGATVAEQLIIDRVLGIIQPGGRFIGRAGRSRSRVRELTGGSAAAEKMFQTLARGGTRMEAASYPGTFYRLSEGVRVGFRPTSKSGPPTVDVFLGDVYVKLKYLD